MAPLLVRPHDRLQRKPKNRSLHSTSTTDSLLSSIGLNLQIDIFRRSIETLLGAEVPLKHFNSPKAHESVTSKNVTSYNESRWRYPDYKILRKFYLPGRNQTVRAGYARVRPGLGDAIRR